MGDERIHLFEDLTLDLARGCLLRADELVHLRPQSYEVLKYLVENNGRLVSKDKLIEVVWQGRAVTDDALVQCLVEIRSALGAQGKRYVRNVRGRGYIFDLELGERKKLEGGSILNEQVEVHMVVIEDEEEPVSGSEAEQRNAQHDDLTVRPATAATAIAGAAHASPSAKYAVGDVRKNKVGLIVALSSLLLAGVGLGYWFLAVRSSRSARIESIAVMPFANESGGNVELEYLSDSMTESLINSLAQLPNLSVKARSIVFRYKGKDSSPQQVAAELSVQAVLKGRVVQRGDDLTLYLSLVDGRNGNQLWGEQYNHKLTDLVSLQSEITRDVSEKLRLRLTNTERQLLNKPGTDNTEAYRAYLKGRYYWSKFPAPGYEKSREYFQQAIDLDPTYAQGYLGLSHYYGFAAAIGILPPNENWPRSEAALNKALALDYPPAETYNMQAGIQLYFHRDWPAAEQSFRKGIELNPNSAEVHHHYARCLVLFRRDKEAIVEMQRAIELDPLSLTYNLNFGKLLFFIRQYDRAIDQLKTTLELEPNFGAAQEWLGYAYEQKGMQREAISEWSKALRMSGAADQASNLERIYTTAGFVMAVRSLGQLRLEQLNEKMKHGAYIPAIEYVNAYMRLDDKEQTLIWLSKAAEERNRFALEIKVNPIYDKLRGDARFHE